MSSRFFYLIFRLKSETGYIETSMKIEVSTSMSVGAVLRLASAFAVALWLTGCGQPVSPAQSVLSADSFSWGATMVGALGTVQDFTLTNEGEAALTGIQLATSGDSSFVQSNNCPGTLGKAQSCTITIGFNPTSSGNLTGSLTVTDSVDLVPQTVTLAGLAGQPTATLSNSSVSFAPDVVGATAAPTTVTLTDSGIFPLAFAGFSLSGNSAFQQSNTCGATLAPGQSCTLTIHFTPESIGNLSGAIQIASNDPASPRIISLSGVSAQPTATVSTANVTFPVTAVGASSPLSTVTLTSTGIVPLTVAGLTLSTGGEFIESGTCSGMLAPQQSCSVNIGFNPTGTGNFNGSIGFIDNASNPTQTVALTGTGVLPVAQLSSPAIQFPNTAIGATSHGSATVTNSGPVPLHISSLAIAGTSAGDFAAGNGCIGTLAPGLSCTLSASFTPAAPSNVNAAVSIYDDASDSPQTVTLSGGTGGSGIHLDYQMMYLPAYGQSLAQGTDSQPAASTVQLYDSLMFAGGVIANANNTIDQSQVFASLVPLVEQSWYDPPGSANYTELFQYIGVTDTGETPLSGTLETIKGLLIRENNQHPADQSYVFIGSSPARGGQPIIALAKGTVPYNLLLSEVMAARGFAQAQGKTFGVPAVTWTQGESDTVFVANPASLTADPLYAAELTELFNDLNTDIKAITGQTKDVQFIMYQSFGGLPAFGPPMFNIALAQLQVAQTLANAHVATPCYPIQNTSASDVHLSALGSKQLGGYYGKWFKRIVVDGNASFKALEPDASSFQVNGNTVSISVPLDQTPLTIDTTNYTSQTGPLPNYGFQLADSTGAEVPIAVTLAGSNTIQVVASEPISPGFILTYGASPDGIHGGWGNIRDNQGSIDIVSVPGLGLNGTALVVPLHNWLREFSHTF